MVQRAEERQEPGSEALEGAVDDRSFHEAAVESLDVELIGNVDVHLVTTAPVGGDVRPRAQPTSQAVGADSDRVLHRWQEAIDRLIHEGDPQAETLPPTEADQPSCQGGVYGDRDRARH